jgi:hypothetical protein
LSRRCALTISFLVGISLLQVQTVSTANIQSLVRTGRGSRQRYYYRRQLPYPNSTFDVSSLLSVFILL